MTVALHLKIVGGLMMALAASHAGMPRYFGGSEELARVSLLTRQIFWVHSFFVCLVLAMMGAGSAFATGSLLDRTPLARLVLGAFAVFWAVRLAFQWLVYDRSLWVGDRFRTFVHFAFTALWIYFMTVYAIACAA